LQNYIIDELAKRGQLKPEFANSIDECTDTTKLYVLPNGYIYAYMLTDVESEQNYTNVLKSATIALDSRYNSSNTLKSGATGYIAVDYISVAPGDVIRFKPASLAQGVSGGYQRLRLLNSSNEVVSRNDMSIDEEYGLSIVDNVATLTIPTSDSTNAMYSQAEKMRMNLYVSSASVTEESLNGLVVTINEEIKESEQTTGYAWTNTGLAFVPADYEGRIIDL
jgi:hypothetical protein